MNNTITIALVYTSKEDKSPLICITDNNTFDYSCIQNLYLGDRNGHGIQADGINDEILLKMCDKIADAIIEAKREMEK